MNNLKKILKKAYRIIKKCTSPNPWDIPLSKRLEIMNSAINNNRKIALYIFPDFDATFRYRCYNVYQATLQSKKWQAIYCSLGEIPEIKKYIKKCSLVIIMRTPWRQEIEELCRLAHKLHKPILFDIDDLICHTSYLPTFIKSLKIQPKDYNFWFSYVAQYEATANYADGFISTNALLSSKLQDTFQKPSYVIKNSLNQEQITISNQIMKNKSLHDKFMLGYFSGSSTHDEDFSIIAAQLAKFLKKYPDAELQLVGKISIPEVLKPFIKTRQITQRNFVDFISLQSIIAKTDICLVPLVKNIFTDCKSELKFFESAVVGVPTIASPAYAYRRAIKNGENGLLCEDDEWFNQLEILYKDRDQLYNISKKAAEYCLKHYSGALFLQQIENTYNKISRDIIIK